jgi:hypothetical protein
MTVEAVYVVEEMIRQEYEPPKAEEIFKDSYFL